MASILDGLTQAGNSPVLNPHPHSPLTFHNRVKMQVVGPDGTVKQEIDHHGNLMVTHGLNRLVEMLASDSDGASDWVSAAAIGTSTTAVGYSQDALQASTQIVHLSQASMAASDAGNLTLQYNLTFASDGNASAIHEIGLFATNAATANMVARSVLGTDSVNRGASDNILASYQIIAQSCA